MSLAERLSALEDYESIRDPSPVGDRRRKLSFNPIPRDWVPPEDNPAPLPAFEVSQAKRIAQVASAVTYCLFGAGVVFGFAAIKPILVSEGVYRSSCTPKEIEEGKRVCFEQELRLNFMYTVAAVFTNMAALPVGTVLDRFGPRVCGIMGASFISIGCIVFSYAWDLAKKNIDGYIIGYLLLALGGPFIFISSFQLSNAFPRYSGLILALLTGAFDTSSAVFLFYRLIYQATNGKFSPKWFFLVYLVVPLFIFTVQFFLMPPSSYKTVGELVFQAEEVNDELIVSDHEDAAEEDGLLAVRRMESRERRESVIAEITQLIGSRDAAKQARHEEATRHVSGVWGAMHGKTATQQVRSAWFVLITLFTVVQMTRINYFVATVRSQYEFLLGSHQDAVAVNNFFDIALPLGGVMSIPFIGYILDNNSTVLVLSVLVFNATLIGILGIIPKIWAAYASICLFVIYRPFYYTCVSDYSAKVFGFHTFGKVYGLIICLSGLFNFIQTPLDALTHKVFNHNPIPVNIALLSVALVVGTSLTLFVWRESKVMDKEALRAEAEAAPEQAMPGLPQIETRDYGTL